jgi:hypothetical protein
MCDVYHRYICIDAVYRDSKSGMYAVYCRSNLFDDSKRRFVYIVYDVRGRYKGQCSVYHDIRSNMHKLRGRIDVLNRYERIHVSTMCDVRGRYVRFDCMHSDNQPGMYKLCGWILFSDSKRGVVYTVCHRVNFNCWIFDMYMYRNFTKRIP